MIDPISKAKPTPWLILALQVEKLDFELVIDGALLSMISWAVF